MLKKLYLFIIAALLITSCGSDEAKNKTAQLTVAEIMAKAVDYVGQEVSVTGTVEHVCKHGGKRMFIMGETPKQRFKIIAGTAVGFFDRKLEGSDVRVEGVVQVQKVDEAFLDNWEAEVSAGAKPEVGHEGHAHGEEQEDEDHHEEDLKKVRSMRQKLQESGKEYLFFYSLECRSFEEIK